MNQHLVLFLREIKRLYSRYGTKETFVALFNNLEQPAQVKEIIGVLKSETMIKVIRSSVKFEDINPDDFIKRVKTVKAEGMLIPFLKKVSMNFNDPQKFGKFIKYEIKERMFNDETLRSIHGFIRTMDSTTLGTIIMEKLVATDSSQDEALFLDEIMLILEKKAA